MELASTRLSQLIGKIPTLHGNMQHGITAGSISGTPAAAAVYDTIFSGAAFVIDYFNYIEVPHFLDEIKVSQLSETLMEDFSKNLMERTLGKNLRIGVMARRITNSVFIHLLGHIVKKEQDAVGVSFRRLRPAAEETCTRWMRFRMIKVSFGCYLTFFMNSCSQSMIFGNVSQHLEKGKRFQKICMTKCCMSKDIDIYAKHSSKKISRSCLQFLKHSKHLQ